MPNNLTPLTLQTLQTLQTLLLNVTDFSQLGDDQLRFLHHLLTLAAVGIEEVENEPDFGPEKLD